LIGGYASADGSQLNTELQYGLGFVVKELGFIVKAMESAKLDKDTLVIIEAKRGQSPINLALHDGPYNAAPGCAQATTDDVAWVWLTPQMQKSSCSGAKANLLSQKSTLSIDTLLDKSDLGPLYRNPFGNNRTPDFIAITEVGLIYTSGTKLEHGGFAKDDRNVALLVSNPSITGGIVNDDVETRQIAPTILDVLGINPKELDGARKETSKVLPGFRE
jgi:hypothetical protein